MQEIKPARLRLRLFGHRPCTERPLLVPVDVVRHLVQEAARIGMAERDGLKRGIGGEVEKPTRAGQVHSHEQFAASAPGDQDDVAICTADPVSDAPHTRAKAAKNGGIGLVLGDERWGCHQNTPVDLAGRVALLLRSFFAQPHAVRTVFIHFSGSEPSMVRCAITCAAMAASSCSFVGLMTV